MTNDRDNDLEGVRQLWAGRFQGVLSTQSLAEPGYPFGSVIPYCLDRSGLPIFLLSHLAQHSKNLAADPRCAFTLAGPTHGDVQQSLRLTCVGDCSPTRPEAADAARRYFSYYPRGRDYFEALNFKLYRLVPRRFHYNGGFATARWLGSDRVLRPSPMDQAAESKLIEQVTQTDPGLLARLAGLATDKEPLRIAGIDPHGLDLALGECLKRIPFTSRLETAEALKRFLSKAANDAAPGEKGVDCR